MSISANKLFPVRRNVRNQTYFSLVLPMSLNKNDERNHSAFMVLLKSVAKMEKSPFLQYDGQQFVWRYYSHHKTGEEPVL